MKRCFLSLLLLPHLLAANEIPPFLNQDEVKNAKFECLEAPYLPETVRDKKYTDILWNETLVYLKGFADALTKSLSTDNCNHSATAMYETKGAQKQCITDNVDVQKMIKHIYAVVHNPEKAKACFNPQIKNPDIYIANQSSIYDIPIGKWLERPTLEEYYSKKNDDPALQKIGLNFARNFNKMILNNQIKMPQYFPEDISAKRLPNLWLGAGWVPMYSGTDERAQNMGEARVRGGYAYAEVMGHWGLLKISTINGEKVGAEIGMTAQAVDSFYPYHHHATSEIYFTIKQPKCINSTKQFVLSAGSPLLKELKIDENQRVIEFNGSKVPNMDSYWQSTTPTRDPLLYIPKNSIHAFDLKQHCESKPHESAHVAVWARTNANRKENDYGSTRVCQLKNKQLNKSRINRSDADVICHQTIYKY